MNIDLERVKQITLNKIEKTNSRTISLPQKLLLIAAIVTTISVFLIGAAKVFDWKVMVGGKIQHGNYGESIVVGEGFAAMSPEKSSGKDKVSIITQYPDDQPNKVAKDGELSLFAAQSDDKSVWSGLFEVCSDTSINFAHIKQLAENAQAKINWPTMITADYEILKNYTKFYTTQKQLKDTKLLYNYFGEWKNQQLFALPNGYEKNINSMVLEMKNPDGDLVDFYTHISSTDSQVYGGSGSAVIEELNLDGYKSVTFVSDNGVNEIHAWKSIPKIKTIDALTFGEKDRPKDNLLSNFHRENTIYQWQQYSFISSTLSKDELMELLKSVDITR